jgi:hypothetical protein
LTPTKHQSNAIDALIESISTSKSAGDRQTVPDFLDRAKWIKPDTYPSGLPESLLHLLAMSPEVVVRASKKYNLPHLQEDIDLWTRYGRPHLQWTPKGFEIEPVRKIPSSSQLKT